MERENTVQFQPELEVPESLDALIVLGKNLGVDWDRVEIKNQRFRLSPHSRISVLAAGMLYETGKVKRIIFSTGKTSGSKLPSEAQSMATHLKRIFPQIPDDAIILEEISLNTDENASNIKKLVKKLGITKIGLLTVSFHLKRATGEFERAKLLPTLTFASDQVLTQRRSPGNFMDKYVENYQKSDLVAREIIKEENVTKIRKMPGGRKFIWAMTHLKRNPNRK